MTKITAAHLREARKILSSPARWIKGTGARDAAGVEVDPSEPRACSFCLAGAIARAADLKPDATTHSWSYACLYLEEQGLIDDSTRIWRHNDDAGNLEEVIRFLDRLIHNAETEEARANAG